MPGMDDEIRKILKQAIEAEIEGFELYSRGAKRTKKAEVRALLNRLANDEAKHKRILEDELELLTNPRASFVRLERGTTPVAELEERLAAAESAAVAMREAAEELAVFRERVEQELETAAEVQRRLLPKGMPSVRGLKVSGKSMMARRVGGDYFDFKVDGDRLFLAIGDVMGKGLPAALLMATMRAAWRAEVAGRFRPAEVLRLVNEATFEDFNSSRSFASFISAEYDARTGKLSFANAGHPSPLFLGRDEMEASEIITSDLLIGIEPRTTFSSTKLELSPGDIVLLYTDGLTEALKPAGAEERIAELLAEKRDLDADGIRDALNSAAIDLVKERGITDDATVLVLKKL